MVRDIKGIFYKAEKKKEKKVKKNVMKIWWKELTKSTAPCREATKQRGSRQNNERKFEKKIFDVGSKKRKRNPQRLAEATKISEKKNPPKKKRRKATCVWEWVCGCVCVCEVRKEGKKGEVVEVISKNWKCLSFLLFLLFLSSSCFLLPKWMQLRSSKLCWVSLRK